MRRFYLERLEDVSGVSGTGIVAYGVTLPSGAVVLEWHTKFVTRAFYNNIEEVIAIHGHDGKTLLRWIDDQPSECEKNLE